ncbi:hypothetical protein M885DRAFT_508277 [Pelagophyceae sp. CCMP2097]|nr:hypothetical protein M885DRAFT_508277 [Pelagophyceae sp. CCMP2097]
MIMLLHETRADATRADGPPPRLAADEEMPSPAPLSAAERRALGYSPRELAQAGFADMPDFLARADTWPRAADVVRARRSLRSLLRAGYELAELRSAGASIEDARAADCALEDVARAGFSAAEFRAANLTAADGRRAGFSVGALREGGYSAPQLIEAGFEFRELEAVGFAPSEWSHLVNGPEAEAETEQQRPLDTPSSTFLGLF